MSTLINYGKHAMRDDITCLLQRFIDYPADFVEQ